MGIRLYVTLPLDISTSVGFLRSLAETAPTSLLVDRAYYNNCTRDSKHCQNENDLENNFEYIRSCGEEIMHMQ